VGCSADGRRRRRRSVVNVVMVWLDLIDARKTEHIKISARFLLQQLHKHFHVSAFNGRRQGGD